MKPHGFPRPRRGALALSMLAVAGLLAACSPGGAPGATVPTAAPTAAPSPTSPPAATDAPATIPPQPSAPEATAPPAGDAATPPPAVPQPTSVSPATPPPMDGGSQPLYLDDRSSPQGVLLSFYNAIERREYARAYSYWEPDAAKRELPPFAQWAQGYANTTAVILTPGQAGNDPGAGQSNYSVPVVLEALQGSGPKQIFGGCYRLHLASPAAQATPPFRPIGIVGATVQTAGSEQEAAQTAVRLCGQSGAFTPGGAQSPPAAAPIDASVYIDDRSTASAAVRSFYNAINRKEFARAYSYWEPDAAQQSLPPFAQWQQGYTGTQSVGLQTGPETSGAAAGNIYVSVPVGITARQSDGSAQRFVGCYTLHMPNPGVESEPPTHPLGIRSASIRQVEQGADLAAQLAGACPAQ